MLRRYLSVFKTQVFLVILIIALVIISTLTKGKTATTFSYLAGAVMILEGIAFFVWIIKTPARKGRDEVG